MASEGKLESPRGWHQSMAKGRAQAIVLMVADGTIDSQQVARYCGRFDVGVKDVLQAADWMAKKRVIIRNPFHHKLYKGIHTGNRAIEIDGMRFCGRCGTFMPVDRFYQIKTNSKTPYEHSRVKKGESFYYSTLCKRHHTEVQTEYDRRRQAEKATYDKRYRRDKAKAAT